MLLDFTSALYLGLRHGSDELRSWAQLTLGAPAVLREEPIARAVAARVAELVGCDAGVAGASTLHVALDLGSLAARERVALFVDAGSYAIQRWGAERASALGVPVTRFAEHDVGALARALRQGAAAGRRPVVIADGFCPACGELAPLPEYLQLARSRGGLLVVDDTQALGVLGEGAGASPAMPYGRGGGGALRAEGVRGSEVLVVVSLAKAFGAPMAVLAGGRPMVGRFAAASETRVHCSPPPAPTLRAAWRALAVNEVAGDTLRARLARNVRHFHAALADRGIPPPRGLFPVQSLAGVRGRAAAALHRGLAARGVATVLTSGHDDAGARVTFVITARHTPAAIHGAVDALATVMADIPQEVST